MVIYSDRGGGGGLHNMRWDPDHIRHIACAGRLYSLLLQQQEGIHFLQTDARGGILQVLWCRFYRDNCIALRSQDTKRLLHLPPLI